LGAAEIGKLRGDVDDPAARLLPRHQPDRLAADKEHAAQVHRHEPVEVLRRRLQQGLLDQDPGVVDQDVETFEPGFDLAQQPQDVVFAGHISGNRGAFTASGPYGGQGLVAGRAVR
jgi:hypothetical protein